MATSKKKTERNPKFRGSTRTQLLKDRLSPAEYELCSLLIQRVTVEEAARQVGYKDPTYAYRILKKPHVASYLEKLKSCVEKKEIEATATQVAKKTVVSRSELMEHIWGLSKLDPEKTNGNITGQVKAAETLGKMLGMMVERHADVTKEFGDRSDEELLYFAEHGEWPERDADKSKPGNGGE